jgi:hypothetical protein
LAVPAGCPSASSTGGYRSIPFHSIIHLFGIIIGVGE